jgi:hypothetical protein
MLEEEEVALARAELHVIEARGRRSDHLAKIARLKADGKDILEAEQTLGRFEAYLFRRGTEISFCVATTRRAPQR